MSLRRKLDVDFPRVWKKLRNRFAKILTQTNFQTEGMEIQADVYDLCNAKPVDFIDALHSALRDFFSEFCEIRCADIVEQDDLLSVYQMHWLKYDLGSSLIDIACHYLNARMEAKAKSDQRMVTFVLPPATVRQLALLAWQDKVVLAFHTRYGNRLLQQVFAQIEQDRLGNIANVAAAYDVIRSLAELQTHGDGTVYRDNFEEPYLAQTKTFFARESAESIATLPMSDYLRLVERRLDREAQRSRACMTQDTIQKVVQECETQLVVVHKERFHTECRRMIEDRLLDDLARTYNLLSRTAKGLDPMLESFKEAIESVGTTAIQLLGDSIIKEPQLYVEKLLSIHQDYSDIVRIAFQRNGLFEQNIDKAFRTIVNPRPTENATPGSKSAELVARYCDLLLRKGGRLGQTDRELDDRLAKTILLFRYLDDKDVFQRHYARLLARRLIFDQSVSDGSEESMISKLKTACGVEYTAKLQRMFQDLSVSKELTAAFRTDPARTSASGDAATELDVMVLTAGSWPVAQSSTLMTSPELASALGTFHGFYHRRFQGRKLTWLYHLSRADLRVNFAARRYELQTSAFQAAVLLQFNQHEKITVPVPELESATSIVGAELTKTLKALIEVKLLTSDDPALGAHATLTLNLGFSSKRSKIKLTAAPTTETPAESQATTRQVDVDRQMFLQALVVRIMKTRKVLTHTLLYEAILRESRTRFAPSIPVIKKCIEDLIDKEFLERAGTNHDEYRYIA